MFFTSLVSNITPAQASVAMSRSDSRDSTSSQSTLSYGGAAYTALLSASPSSSWSVPHTLTRSDSTTSSTHSHTSSTSSQQHESLAMRRNSSNSNWLPSPYRSCQHAFGSDPNSYLSDDDLLCPINMSSLLIESIPPPAPKKELTTEEQIAFLRELQEKEAAHQYQQAAHQTEIKRKVVRFAGPAEATHHRPSLKRRHTPVRRGLSALHGPQ